MQVERPKLKLTEKGGKAKQQDSDVENEDAIAVDDNKSEQWGAEAEAALSDSR